jgi:hypothetical protein
VSRSCMPVDNGKGADGPERGARFLRGEDSEGRDPRDGCGMEQGREARVGQEAAERLRKPVSGTEVGLDNLSQKGLPGGCRWRDQKAQGSRSGERVGRPGGSEETLKGSFFRGE